MCHLGGERAGRAAALQEPCGWGGQPATTPGSSVLIWERSSGTYSEGPGGAPSGLLVSCSFYLWFRKLFCIIPQDSELPLL